MRTLATAALLSVVLAVSACGSTSGTTGPGADACTGRGVAVAKADLDGDGQVSTVRLTMAGSGPCAHRLLAEGGASADVADLDLVPRPAKVVHLRGSGAPDLVLLSARPHPRGGWQPHLFAAGGAGGLVEVTVHGRPVVPFVATDGGAPPMTATCTPDGGIAVLTGKAHRPPGIVLAWDVTETSYELKGGRAVETGSRLVEKAVADPLLRKDHPELFARSLFADCS
jgi:hypothetical protein